MLLAIPVLGLGIFESIRDYSEVERQAFSGQVSYIDWESKNHQMPLVEITQSNGSKVKFHHTRIVLDSSHLKVGDSITKESGSLECKVNDRIVRCIE